VKIIAGSLVAAIGASACCLGPVVFSLVGAGALAAASMRLEPYRPWFLAATVVLLGTAFVTTYRASAATCGEVTCPSSSRRRTRMFLWLAVVLVVLLVTFPYYVAWWF
jgi:mercuric ion transport protein